MFGEVRGVEAVGGAREFVWPCSKLGIGQVPLRVSRQATQKCWEKDKVADTPPRQRVNSCRGKRKLCLPEKSEGIFSIGTCLALIWLDEKRVCSTGTWVMAFMNTL